MDAVIEHLRDPDFEATFERNNGWLIGARFSALQAIDMDLVLWDSNLYGLMVHLRGDRAGSWAGLRFEILYRKINEQLGVYHADLELPVVMRRLELGVVSVTMSAITVDIYTDGSFLIDLGFPNDLDFSRSFAMELFPFVGYGGFQVGLLPQAATPNLPVPVDGGRFNPIVALGIGLSVGVGKTIEMGPLSAGMTVTMVGVFDGIVAPYIDQQGEQAGIYYRATATVGLIGRLYGSINFGIISANVDILATATATVLLEAHRPTRVLLEAAVAANVSVKVLFVTLHFNFEARVRAEFVIGAATTAPWEIPASTDHGPMLAAMPGGNLPGVSSGVARFALTAPAKPLRSKRISVPLWFVPQVSIGIDGDGDPAVQVIAMLAVDMTVGESGRSDFSEIVDACFAWAVDIIAAATGIAPGVDGLRPAHFELLQQQLGRLFDDADADLRPADRLTPAMVMQFWDDHFTYKLEPWPAAKPTGQSFTIFPMSPFYRLQVSAGEQVLHEVDFAEHKPCSDRYQRWLGAWSERLRRVTESESGTEPPLARGTRSDDPPLAGLVMVDYCRTILRTILGDARSAFDFIIHETADGETFGSLIRRFGFAPIVTAALCQPAAELDHEPGADEPPPEDVRHVETLTIPAGGTIDLPDAADPIVYAIDELAAAGVVTTRTEILAANADQGALLAPGAEITDFAWPVQTDSPDPAEDPAADEEADNTLRKPIAYTVLQLDTLASVTAAIAGQLQARGDADETTDLTQLSAAIVAQTAGLFALGAALRLPELVGYIPKLNESVDSIAKSFGLEPTALVEANQSVVVTGAIGLAGCTSLTPTDLMAAFEQQETVRNAGAMAARYFLHGLQLPDPDDFDGAAVSRFAQDPSLLDDLPLGPLYELLGQQFTLPVDHINNDESWSSLQFDLGPHRSDRTVTPEDISDTRSAGVGYAQLLESPEAELSFAERLAESFTTISPDRPYLLQPRFVSLDNPVRWQHPEELSDEDGDAGTVQVIDHLVSLPATARGLLDQPARLLVTSHADGPEGTSPLPVRWVTRIDVVAERISDPDVVGGFLSGIYQVGATDVHNGQDLLRAIEAVGENDQLLLAYQHPGGGLRTDELDPVATALVRTNLSTATRPPDVPLMRADTGEQSSARPPNLVNAKAFLQTLWQGTTINQPGLYLNYVSVEGADESTVDEALDQDGGGVLSIMVVWDPQAAGQHRVDARHNAVMISSNSAAGLLDSGYTIAAATTLTGANQPGEWSGTLLQVANDVSLDVGELALANATTPDLIIPGGEITSEDGRSHTTTQGDDLLLISLALDVPLEDWGSQPMVGQIRLHRDRPINVHRSWLTQQSVIPQDSVAVRLQRQRPPEGQPGTIEALAATYNLVGIRVTENATFRASSAVLPLGPESPQGNGSDSGASADEEGPLLYRRVLNLSNLRRRASHRVANGDRNTDPVADLDYYHPVGDTAELAIRLVDLYGNETDDVRQVSIPIGYRDKIIGPDQWPGVHLGYDVLGRRSRLQIRLSIDPTRHLGEGSGPPASRARRIAADHQQLLTAERQMGDPKVQTSLWCSLDETEARTVPTADLVKTIRSARIWTQAVASLAPLTVRWSKGGSLQALAERYGAKSIDLARINVDTPGFLRTGAVFVAPSGADGGERSYRVAKDETIRSVAERAGQTAEDLVAANAERNVIRPNTDVAIPFRDEAPDDAEGECWHTIGATDELRVIARKYRIPVGRLIAANQTLTKWLKPGYRLKHPEQNVYEAVTRHDTLGTVLARLEDTTGSRIDPVALVTANEPGSRRGGVLRGVKLEQGERLLIPPRDRTRTIPLQLSSSADVVPLRAELNVERPAALVDRHMRFDHDVWRSIVQLSPVVNTPSAGGTVDSDASLRRLAAELAKALPGWRLARESAPLVGAFRHDTLVLAREPVVRVEGAPVFHAVTPLATAPWHATLPLATYESGRLGEPIESQRFGPVDVDRWNRDAFELIESVLSAKRVRRLHLLAAQAIADLASAKKELAEAVSRRTASVLMHPDRSDGELAQSRSRAAEVVKQQLLARLDNVDHWNCVVDYGLNRGDELAVSSERPGVRLFGNVTAVGADLRLIPIGVRAGEAKVEDPSRGRSGLTFNIGLSHPGLETEPASRLTRRRQTPSVGLELVWRPVSVEYDIKSMDGGYERSRWATFVVPPESVEVRCPAVPVVNRDLPASPRLIRQRTIDGSEGHDGPGRSRSYRYEIVYEQPAQTSDRAEVSLSANDSALSPIPNSDHLVDIGPIAETLTQIAVVREALLGDIDGDDPVISANALSTLVELADRLVVGWNVAAQARPPLMAAGGGPGQPDPDNVVHTVVRARRSREAKATSVMLDGVDVHAVRGEVTVHRNEDLVAGRATNPDFVSRSDVVHLPGPAWFAGYHDDKIDTTFVHHSIGPSLEHRLIASLRRLTNRTSADVNKPALDIEIEAWLVVGRTGQQMRTPIGLWPRRRLMSAELYHPSDSEDGISADPTDSDTDSKADPPSLDTPGLIESVADVLRHNQPGDHVKDDVNEAANWLLAVRLYSGLRSGAANGPVMVYRQVVIPVASVV